MYEKWSKLSQTPHAVTHLTADFINHEHFQLNTISNRNRISIIERSEFFLNRWTAQTEGNATQTKCSRSGSG